jgi:hypothetical protein
MSKPTELPWPVILVNFNRPIRALQLIFWDQMVAEAKAKGTYHYCTPCETTYLNGPPTRCVRCYIKFAPITRLKPPSVLKQRVTLWRWLKEHRDLVNVYL